MLQVRVWSREREYQENSTTTLRYLRPRLYMSGWSFERVWKYVKEECYWNDIEKQDIICVEFFDTNLHIVQSINNPNYQA